MNFERLAIPDLVICEPEVIRDDRGYFAETYRQDKLQEFLGYSIEFCQDNEARSSYGVLRGLHYQLPPFAQTKLVRVIQGLVLDVTVDVRKGSPTFGQHVALELSGENRKQLLIPRGFAHGYVVLSKKALFAYKVDNTYNPEHDRGIAFDDKTLGIDWGIPSGEIQLSPKDLNLPSFNQAAYFDYNLNLYA